MDGTFIVANKYFNQYNYVREQRLTEDLITEAVEIHGLEMKYLPRTIWNEDILFGEDPLSKFNDAVSITLYVKSNTGFEGQGDFLSKFGVELRDQVVFVMSRKRWLQITTEKLLVEVDGIYQQESGNTKQYANSEGFLLETGTANGYNITSSRPNEGDLLYFGPGQDLFEIKFIEHENPFYPHGKKFTYVITCEKFRYSSESISTGNTEIDVQASAVTMDMRLFSLLLEDNTTMLDEETGDHFIQEYRVEINSRSANNEYIGLQAGSIIDFSDTNPFSELEQ